MTGEYVGVVDQGTTGTRFVVVDGDGRPVADAFTSSTRQRGAGGRVESDPAALWSGVTDAIRRALDGADVAAADLTALGVANQRQTALLWDRATGEPVTPAVSWQDRRATDRVADLDDETAALVRDRTGLVPDPYFAAPTLATLIDREGLGERARAGDLCFGTVDSWLVYNLTGEHVTDVTNAAQTMLFDIHDLAWDEDLLSVFDVPAPVLPEVAPSSDPDGFGRTDPDGLLGAEIPVTGVLGDQQAALLGQARFDVGDAKVTYGSGNFFVQNTGRDTVEDPDLLTTVWFQRVGDDPWYALEGPLFTTGAAIEWLESVGLVEDAGRIDAVARGTDDPSDVVVVPAFDGLGAPQWEPRTRAAVFGLSRRTDPEQLVRATLEAIGFGTRAVVEAAEEATGFDHGRLCVDGSAVYDDSFAQLQADLLGRRVVRPAASQTTALGAACAAGLAAGVWEDPADFAADRQPGRTFRPSADRDAVDDRYRRWQRVTDVVADFYASS